MNKIKNKEKLGSNSSRSLKNLVKNRSSDKRKMPDLRKQIYASLIPKVEFDVVTSEDGKLNFIFYRQTKINLYSDN